MLGILAICKSSSGIHDHDGGIDRNSSTDETKLSLSSLVSGPRSWTTGLSRKCGRLLGTGSPSASLTSGTTTRITGIARTAMKTGNSVMMASWFHGLHQSTTLPFWDQSANITGCSGVVPMTTQVKRPRPLVPSCRQGLTIKGGEVSAFRRGCGAEPRGHFHQVGERVGLHFLHHLASVCLHSDLADAKFPADLFI